MREDKVCMFNLTDYFLFTTYKRKKILFYYFTLQVTLLCSFKFINCTATE